jgi:hypothetical protein
MLKWLIVMLAVFMAVRYLLTPGPVELGPGVTAPDAPRQAGIDQAKGFTLHGYRITPLADFAIRAKVLGREDYRFDREAELAPIDLALGWGRMSDEAVLRDIEVSQGGRWYHWRTERMPIPRREIETHSANMHLIPADDTVLDALETVREGQVVELRGYLVRVDHADGWRWVSSLSRDDRGARACELVYVRRAAVVSG